MDLVRDTLQALLKAPLRREVDVLSTGETGEFRRGVRLEGISYQLHFRR